MLSNGTNSPLQAEEKRLQCVHNNVLYLKQRNLKLQAYPTDFLATIKMPLVKTAVNCCK